MTIGRWRKTIAVSIVALGLLSLTGFALVYYFSEQQPQASIPDPIQNEKSQKKISKPERQSTIPSTIIANVEPYQKAIMTAPVQGRIQEKKIKEGMQITSDMIPDSNTELQLAKTLPKRILQAGKSTNGKSFLSGGIIP